MSDSDDTDILLLIPPQIFIDSVEREVELNSLQTQVVGSLIDQVSELENRISYIESVNSSCGNDSLIDINHSMVLNDSDLCEYVRVNESLENHEDLVSPSLVLNTCEINSNTESSLDLNHRDNGLSKSKETLLKEIDTYLSSLGTRGSKEGRGVDSENTSELNDNSVEKELSNRMTEDRAVKSPQYKRLDLPEVDRLLKEMEVTQMEIENKLRMRENDYGLGGEKSFTNLPSRKSFPPLETSTYSLERNSTPFSTYSSPLKLQDFDKMKNDDFGVKRDSFLVGSSHNSDSDDARKNSDRPHGVKPSASFERRRFVSPRRKLFHPDNISTRKPASGQSSVTNALPYSRTDSNDYLSQLAAGDNAKNPSARIPDLNGHRGRQPLKYNRYTYFIYVDLLIKCKLIRTI